MAASQVQALLRFLSQDAKVPLATAMGRINELIKADLTSAETISKGGLKPVQEIFKDDRIAKQIYNAAKRLSKKRSAPAESTISSPSKRSKASSQGEAATPFSVECALALPVSTATEEELSNIVLLTNRAPLVLAFAVCALRYTMPEQPISSRLSLAQALVSANSRSKAVSLGIESGKSTEEEEWGEGQPTVFVLGRKIKVLKRWDYNSREGQPAPGPQDRETISDDILGHHLAESSAPAPPLWGVDTEASRRANNSDTSRKTDKMLPIHTPQSARSYLLKSFTKAPGGDAAKEPESLQKRNAALGEEKQACLSQLLQSIDLVCQSWAPTLTVEELDRRAWAWYVHVRPSIQSGREGWGEKGAVKLSEILSLKRQSS
ncbi:hypothetical protein BJY04DRAFT_214949 [Aspergillus karnatakaensis]|uniref:uncharacterized protein n=1 Tax=Aspergillus karnatakaensis TaxID=1810916 RepID=UPI003CCDCFF6